MRPSGHKWLQIPAKKSLFRRTYPSYPPTYPSPFSQISVPEGSELTVKDILEERERKKKEEEEIEKKLNKMKLELGIGGSMNVSSDETGEQLKPDQPAEEILRKRVQELENLLTESLRKNIKMEMERDRAVENYHNIVTQMRSVVDKAE